MLGDLRRNFKGLVLGSTRVWEAHRFSGNPPAFASDFMVAARPCRSLEGIWWSLQHMHSYVRKGGIVAMVLDLGDRTQRIRGFSYGEVRTFHPVANRSLGLRDNDRVRIDCWRFHPLYCVVLLSAFLANRGRKIPLLRFWSCPRASCRQHQRRITEARDFFLKANDFCAERGLSLHVSIIIPKKTSGKQKQQIIKHCRSTLNELSHGIYLDAKELMQGTAE